MDDAKATIRAPCPGFPAGNTGPKRADATRPDASFLKRPIPGAAAAVITIRINGRAYTPDGERKMVFLMKQRSVRFEADLSLDHVEVVIRAPAQDEEVTALLEQLDSQAVNTVTAFDGFGRMRTISPGAIISASVDGKLVHIVTADGSWFTRRTLQSLENSLDSQRFVRVSRYELVNLDKVLRYDFTIAGTLRLELAGGTETWASRRCIPDIRKRLQRKE